MKKYILLILVLLSILISAYLRAANVKPAPKITVPNSVHHFGELTPGAVVSHEFVIHNTGNADLVIYQVAAACYCSKTELEAELIKPGGQALLKIYLDTTDKLPGEFVGAIEVFSNDPDQLVTKLQLKAEILTKSAPQSPDRKTASKQSWQTITPQAARDLLKKEPAPILLDVRTPEEYAKGHIPKSVLIPLDCLTAEAPKKLTDRQALIIVYCRAGVRSKKAAQALAELGYCKVYDLGGIEDWPYEVESEN